MESELEKNKDIEDAFSKIRLICGTNNLKNIINKVLLKDKKYNYTITQINQKEQEKKEEIPEEKTDKKKKKKKLKKKKQIKKMKIR